MEFRELKSDDFFTLMSIIGKLGITDSKEAATKIFTNMANVKTDLNKFLASLTGKTLEEIADLSAKEYAKLAMRIISGPEATEVFTSLASGTAATDGEPTTK